MGTSCISVASLGQQLNERFGEDSAGQLLAYRPEGLSDAVWMAIRDLVLEILVRGRPKTGESARKSLSAIVSFISWAYSCGLVGDVEDFFTPENVEAWREIAGTDARRGCGTVSPQGVSDYVSRLRSMGPRITPEANWPPQVGRLEGGNRRHLRGPYTDVEVLEWWRAVQTAPKGTRRLAAEAFLGLGFGAGPFPREYALITPSMVKQDHQGMWLEVPGEHARRVPVAVPWSDLLLRAATARRSQDKLLQIPRSKNGLASALAALRLTANRKFLSPQRMRTTWMVHRLRAGVDPRLVRDWAGLKTLNSLPDLVSFMPEPDAKKAVAPMQQSVVESLPQ